jgi:hypothetical protein
MPPGYGGAPPGQGNGMPPGYGGGMPPGYGGPPGVPPGSNAPQAMPGQYPPGLAQPPKSNRMLLIAGLGCGLFLLLAIAAVVVGVFWLKARGNAAVEELQRLQASASAIPNMPLAPESSAASAGALTGDCLVAYRCCQAIASKSPAGAAAIQACEVLKTPGYPVAICSSALAGYRKVAEQTGVKCE